MINGLTRGTAVREYPKFLPSRGWSPQDPMTRTTSLPVTKDGAGNPIRIQSGQIISRSAANEWVLGIPAGQETSPTLELFIAQDDSSPSWEFDTSMAGKLVGLDCSGQFTLGSAFFIKPTTTNGYVYKAGTHLTPCKSTETLVNYAGATIPASGYYRPAAAGEPVFGVIAVDGVANLRGGEAMTGANPNPYPVIALAQDSSAVAVNEYVVWLKTCFSPGIKLGVAP